MNVTVERVSPIEERKEGRTLTRWRPTRRADLLPAGKPALLQPVAGGRCVELCVYARCHLVLLRCHLLNGGEVFEEAPTIEGSETFVLDGRQSVSNDSRNQRPGRTHFETHGNDARGRRTSW